LKNKYIERKKPLDLNEKIWTELSTLIKDFGQSTAIVSSGTDDEWRYVREFYKYLSSSHKIIYIDFKDIKDMRDLADKIIEQCSSILKEIDAVYPFDIWREEENYRYLDRTLNMLQSIGEKNQLRTVFWSENFTEVLKLEEANIVCSLMRSEFQKHTNIVHVFTSDNQNLINEIFLDRKKPFFRFIRIVKTFEYVD